MNACMQWLSNTHNYAVKQSIKKTSYINNIFQVLRWLNRKIQYANVQKCNMQMYSC
jgi:hypothetical protein